jgi:hypothetical protein
MLLNILGETLLQLPIQVKENGRGIIKRVGHKVKETCLIPGEKGLL